MNGPYDRDVVGNRPQVRQELGQSGPWLAIPLERKRGTEQPRGAFDEGDPLPLRDELGGNLLPVVFLQRRFVVEEVELRWRARHEEIDDLLCLWREVRRAGRKGSFDLAGEQAIVKER